MRERTCSVIKPLLPDWKAISLIIIQMSLNAKRHLIALAMRLPRATVTNRALGLMLSAFGLKTTGLGSQSESERK